MQLPSVNKLRLVPVFEKACETAGYLSFSPPVQKQYQKDLMAYRDNKNVQDTARDEGKAEGLAEKAAEFTRNHKRMGLKPTDITQATGLSVAEIERLD